MTESAEGAVAEPAAPEEPRVTWLLLTPEERLEWFRLLERPDAEEFFLALAAPDQSEVLRSLPAAERRAWMRLLAPDDAADLVQATPPDEREGLLALLDDRTQVEVRALLAFAEDDAGGLMNPRYARVRPDITVDEAIAYVRRQARERLETIYVVYVIDAEQRLVGVVSLRDLFVAPTGKTVRDVMRTEVVTAPESMDQEALSHLFAESDLPAIPVVDDGGRMKGIVTVDDIVDVVQEEATEDIQKIGGTGVLDAPYLQARLRSLVAKRAGWLVILFLGQMLTATVMAHFADELRGALVLALFVPLIISSGGNAGSQSSTLVIRAMALGEVRLRDALRVFRREIVSGVLLGALLGALGLVRVLLGFGVPGVPAEHVALLGLTVAASVVGVVLFGTLAGAMLPMLLRRVRLDPASASAPFVATLVDVTGLVVYFLVAALLLRGTLL
jgi:magnesium transporter